MLENLAQPGVGAVAAIPSAPAAATRQARIAIVIPCYNGARFLPAAIESCLKQTMRDFELIVVDDASPDNCTDIADRYAERDGRIRVIRRAENGGVSEAFNTGYKAASAPYFTRLAQDDLFADDALATMVAFLDSHPDVGLTYCDYGTMDESGKTTGRIIVPVADQALLFGNRVGLCVAWRREVWQRVGGFNREFDTAEDYEYWLRIWDQFSIAKCTDGAAAPMMVRDHEAMGSRRFADRQESTTIRILRLRYSARIPWAKRVLLRRKAISRIRFSAAADYSEKGLRWRALGRIVRSLMGWPLPYRRDEVKMPLARVRLLAALVLGTTKKHRRSGALSG